MTDGMGQAIVIVLLFAFFFFLKIVLTTVGLIIQSNRELPSKAKNFNILGMLVLLLSWLPFVFVVFHKQGPSDSSMSDETMLVVLNSILLFSNLIALVFVSVNLNTLSKTISKTARGFWFASALLLAINVIVVIVEMIVANAERPTPVAAVFFIETVFFITFFIGICSLPKKAKKKSF